MCRSDQDQGASLRTAGAHNALSARSPKAPMTPTTPTTPTTPMSPVDAPLSFEDAAIFLAVELFYWLVCLGFFTAGIISPVFWPVAKRMAMGLCAVAHHAQLESMSALLLLLATCNQTQHQYVCVAATKPAANNNSTHAVSVAGATPATATTTTTTRRSSRPSGPQAPIPIPTPVASAASARTLAVLQELQAQLDARQCEHLRLQLEQPSSKASPALHDTIPRSHSQSKCTLLWSSHNVSPTQRSAIDHARHILDDAHVVFDEVDAAIMMPEELQVFLHIRGARAGVYPQVFVETSQTTEWPTPTRAQRKPKPEHPPLPTFRCISMKQLEKAQYYADVPLEELVRLGVVLESALFMFQDVPSRRLPTHTFGGQLRALGGALVLRDASLFEKPYAPWHVAVDMSWTRYMFEDAWDIFTALKLYSLMP